MSQEISDAIETAINALSLAKLLLSKGAKPSDQSDVLRKASLADTAPRANANDLAAEALRNLDSAERRVDKLEAGKTIGESK